MMPVLRRDLRRRSPGTAEQLERARIPAARPRLTVQPRHGLDVVIEDVRPRVEHRAQRRFLALEVGDQHLDAALRPSRLDRPDRLRERAGAEVRQVIAIDGGDDDVGELEGVDGVREVLRLVEDRAPPARRG